MLSVRLTIFSVMMLLLVCCSTLAQRPGPEFWRRVSCEPLEPRTKLEAFEEKYATVLVKGFTRITTVEIRGIRIDALELRDPRNSTRARGVVIALREAETAGERSGDNRVYIDYEEIDSVISGLDAVAGVNETLTKLASFEARYRTLGDLEIAVFRQTQRGMAASLSTGVCNRTITYLTLDELAKVKAMILEAKEKLDQSR